MEELAKLEQLLPDQEWFLSINITVGDLLPSLDVSGGLYDHPEAVL